MIPRAIEPGSARGILHAGMVGLTLWLGAGIASARAGVETWRYDPLHTQITVFVGHLGFSHAAARLRLKQGWFQFDADDWSSARTDLEIDLDSLDLGDKGWNDNVKSAQFLNVKRWPLARFRSTRVETTGSGQGILHGELSLHGVTQAVAVPFRLNRIGTDPYTFKHKVGFSATASLSRSDFGMARFADVVGDAIELRIEVEGVRASLPISSSPTPSPTSDHGTEEY